MTPRLLGLIAIGLVLLGLSLRFVWLVAVGVARFVMALIELLGLGGTR